MEPMSTSLLHPQPGRIRHKVTTATAGWRFLEFSVVDLAPGESHTALSPDREIAVVPLRGSADIELGDLQASMARTDVFDQMPTVAYAPPGTPLRITAAERFEFAIGSAPARGIHPPRLITPPEMKSEVRGGGAALRQVNHILAPPIPAERLILYEVYVPRGSWSGWPPHCHDGRDGSPYLEETYYFRLDPTAGFAMHRNWRDEESFDETMAAGDEDLVLVPRGYHSTAACPGGHMFFLNFLAGDLIDGERITPPCFHSDHTWIENDWDAFGWDLPRVHP